MLPPKSSCIFASETNTVLFDLLHKNIVHHHHNTRASKTGAAPLLQWKLILLQLVSNSQKQCMESGISKWLVIVIVLFYTQYILLCHTVDM